MDNQLQLDFLEEEWRDVKDYKGHYQVSNLGNVKSLNYARSGKIKLLKNIIKSTGYVQVCLCKNGRIKCKKVHSLVAIAFLNHTPDGYKLVINHIDFNPLNNNVNNLEVVTQRENTNLKHIKSSSKYTGVSKSGNSNRWISRIVINGAVKILGYFDDEIEAHQAYQKELSNIINN